MTRRDLLQLLGLAASLAAVPDVARRYFIIGQPERRLSLSVPPIGDHFDQLLIDDLVSKARSLSPPIRPYTINGEQFYAFIIDPRWAGNAQRLREMEMLLRMSSKSAWGDRVIART